MATGERERTIEMGARVERIAGGGHAFMAQAPERVARLIVAFAPGA